MLWTLGGLCLMVFRPVAGHQAAALRLDRQPQNQAVEEAQLDSQIPLPSLWA